jgi:hypothetical protein
VNRCGRAGLSQVIRKHRSIRADTSLGRGAQPAMGRKEAMNVTMICPNLQCGRTLVAADTARGKVVRCAHCQQLFMVPPRQNGTPEEPVEAAGKPAKKG